MTDRIDKRQPDPRIALAQVAAAQRVTLTDLSTLLGKAPGYISRFINDGVPRALSEEQHAKLADFLGVDPRGLGIRDLWIGG